MNRDLSSEAVELGLHARRALTGAAAEPKAIEATLGVLGASDLDVSSADELEAAAALCHAAGWCATPYPVAERLAPGEGATAIVLTSWTLLGMLDRAVALACEHAAQRRQFGRPLADLQGVQFMLTEAEVERAGVDELARYALWSIQTAQPGALADALALRVAALDAARVVFRVAHQVHGASGFCDDTEISWLSRRSEPLRREPLGGAATLAALTDLVEQDGFAGLFTPETARRA
jgi:3-oxo-4-pregnene-20-carboxyl-CoA dehydrogenase alpha subunit